MQLFTRGLYKCTLDVTNDTTVIELFDMIMTKMSWVCREDVYIIHNGRVLDITSDMTISEAKIKQLATLDICGRLRGNCPKCNDVSNSITKNND